MFITKNNKSGIIKHIRKRKKKRKKTNPIKQNKKNEEHTNYIKQNDKSREINTIMYQILQLEKSCQEQNRETENNDIQSRIFGCKMDQKENKSKLNKKREVNIY